MKMKLSLAGVAIVTISLGLALTSGAFAQMYGGKTSQTNSKSNAQSSGQSSSSNEPKPGQELTGGVIVATPITQDEAQKKYPAPKGGYPMGERDPAAHSGLIISPYPPRKTFDCSHIGHGQLVLDTYTKHVFVRP